MDSSRPGGLANEPVKVIVERRIRPGAEGKLTAWAERFVAAAARSGSLEGSSVLAPAHSGSLLVLLRFASTKELECWQGSADYQRLLDEADRISDSGAHSQVRTGMETWFTLPDSPIPQSPPPKWKMALTTWIGLFPMVVALGFIFQPFAMPVLVAQAISTLIPTALLTWVVMPKLTRLLYGWLYARPEARDRSR
jgi:antibiotic biosynthesis monooxygenase (ABM) superfamily enzyme